MKMMLIISISIIFLSLRCICGSIDCSNILYNELNNIPYSELYALCDLYKSTNGGFWAWKNDSYYGYRWNFTNPSPCIDKWQGISCMSTNEYKYTVVNLTLVSYHLNGSLPHSIGDLTNLISLTLDTNNLTSSIPSSIGYLKNLTRISMNHNQLTNTVPNSIQELTNLTHLELWDNYLIGTFPSFLCELLELRVIFIPYNQFHGELPNCLGNLTEMRAFVVESNKISGTIPSSLGLLNKTYFLDLNFNYFLGSIPESLGNLKNLKYLDLYSNMLTGNIPKSFKNLTTMETLLISKNSLTGTFPIEFSHLYKLYYLYASDNLLTGILPDTISSFINIDTLELGANYFSGSIPNTIGDFKRINTLFLGPNHLSGSIPVSIGKLTTLYNLDFQKNDLIGKLPESISQMKSLTSLNLLNNKLSGSLKHVFNADIQVNLSSIQLSHNQFTGIIPDEIFKLSDLTSLSLESNCFEASLPVELCQSTKLKSVDLNGLHTATDCQYLILPGLSHSYISLGYVIDPSIPSCYFNMPHLSVLHLSGNSLTGKIPTLINENLTNLILSHNSISGSIPSIIQERKWINLDLSHNKLNGLLHSTFAKQDDNSSLNLVVNRLSGNIPHHLFNMKNISILNGNIFSCATVDDLPKHDNNKYTYECGSNSFNTPYLVFGIMLGSVIFILVIIIKYHKQIKKYIKVEYIIESFSLWYHFNERFRELMENRMQTYKRWCEFSNGILRITFYSSLYIIFILSTAYVILAQFYETLHYSYAWTVSLAFSSGVISGSIELVLLIILICYIIILYQWFIYEYTSTEDAIKTRDIVSDKDILSTLEVSDTINSSIEDKFANTKNYRIVFEKIKIYGIYMLINFIVTLGANIAYIYAVFYANPSIIALSRILISIFKLFWSGVCNPVLVSWCIYYLSKNNIDGRRTEFFTIQLFVGLTNNITIPCITVAVISPNCFYNFFVKLNSIDSVYYYIFRYKQFVGSNSYAIADITNKGTTSYDPPFVYGYQCASSIITSYSPAFVYQCILAAFVNPIGQVLLQQVHHHIEKKTYLNKIICSVLPQILKDIDDDNINSIEYINFKTISNTRQVTVNLLTFLGILLTFGAAFPPLAFPLLVTIYISTNFAYLKIRRFLYNAVQSNHLNCLDVIDSECYGSVSGKLLKRSQWMLACFCSCFYSLFIFDAFGDEVGGSALWILIVVPFTPVIIYLIRQFSYYIYNRYYHVKSVEIHTSSINIDVELTSEVQNTFTLDKADHPTQVFFNPMIANNDKTIDN